MTISDLLVITKGSQVKVSQMLGVNRETVRRYKDDKSNHFIIKDGEVYSLFTRVGG